MLFAAVVLAACLAVSQAIVCSPVLCEGVQKTPLNCKGAVIKGGGFCGCTDACAKVEGEECSGVSKLPLLGVPSVGTCDSNLICKVETLFGRGTCVQNHPAKRSAEKPTACEQLRRLRMISMVVWRGQWTPKCDKMGNFLPQQCDNTGTCFCVHTNTGVKIEGTSVLGGPASC